LENLKAGARIEFSVEKRNVSDFAVWKWIREGEDHAMKWEYRGRMGYPGWHLECSTIIHEELGEPIDIHTGGVDHVPVHHTNEIAQSEAAFGVKMANYWTHCNHITIEGEKISKSLGNVYYFSDLAERGFTMNDYKLWIFQGHYQANRNFSFADLGAAHQRLLNYRNFAALRWQRDVVDFTTTREKMMAQLNANMNSAGALAELDVAIKQGAPNDEFLNFLDEIFGLQIAESTPDISDELKTKIEKRFKAKKEKDFATADALRDEISDEGIALLDGADGSIWQYAE
jgi:cysteinyl-tRNA synthetase